MRHSVFTTGTATTTNGSSDILRHPRHHLSRKVDRPGRRSVDNRAARVVLSGGAGAVRMGAAEVLPTAAVEADPSIRLVEGGLLVQLGLERDLTASGDAGLRSDDSMQSRTQRQI
jgi:hypothetical protein